MELAFDLCTLALYDVAIYADDSTSMKYAEGALNSNFVCCFLCGIMSESTKVLSTLPECCDAHCHVVSKLAWCQTHYIFLSTLASAMLKPKQ